MGIIAGENVGGDRLKAGFRGSESQELVGLASGWIRLWAIRACLMPRRLIVLAGSILALHVVIAATLQGTPRGFLASNILQNFSAGLAAVLCFLASRRGQGLSRPFWLLVSCAMLAWGAGNLGWMYYQYFLHVEPPAASITRFLFDSQVVFLAMVSFLDPDRDSPHFDAESLLDFVQLAIVFSLIYLKLYYATAVHLDSLAAMFREFKVETGEDLVLVGLAVLQFTRARLQHVRHLYGGLIVYLVIYLLGAAISDLHQVLHATATGTWFDMSWTIPMLVASVWAAGWTPAENPDTPLAGRKTIGQLLTANATYAIVPIVVLIQVAGLGAGFRFTRYALLGASIVCYAARLGISQYRFEHAAEQLRDLFAVSKSSEARFRSLIERSSDLITVLDSNGTIRYVSPSSERVVGFQPDALLGKRLLDFVQPEDLSSAQTALTGLAPGASRDFAVRFRHADGSVRILEMISTNLLNELSIAGTVVNSRDVTDRKRAQAELEFRNVLLSTQQDSSLDGILVVDPNHKIISFNSRFVQMFGIPPEAMEAGSADLARQLALDVLEDPQSFSTQIAYLYEHPEETSHDELRLKDGRIFDRYSAPMSGADGKHYGRVWYTRDVTELKRSQEDLRKSEERYRSVVAAMSEGVVLQEADGRVVACNESGERILGVSAKQLLGHSSLNQRQVTTHEDGSPFPGETHPPMVALRTGRPQSDVRMGVRKPNGDISWVSINSRPLFHDHEGLPYAVVSTFTDITERKRAEATLRESEERLRMVVQSAPVGIALLDKDSVVLMCNPAFAHIAELTEQQVLGKRLDDPSLRALREDGTPCPLEERPSVRATIDKLPVLNVVLRHSDTSEREGKWLLASAWPLLKADGSVYQVITTLTDITRQKQVEEELRSGRELIAQSQKAAQLGCFDWDIKKGTTVFSPELEDLYGLAPGTFEGGIDDWKAMVVPEDLELAMGNLENVFKTGEALDEFRIRRRSDGDVRWVSSRGRVYYNEAGEPIRMIGINMDVTERKRAEEALRRSEAEFRMILENAAIGMTLVDVSGRLLRVNPAFQKLLGYTRDELETMTFADITHPEDAAVSSALFRELVEGKRSGYRVKKRYVRKDGELRWAWLTVSAMRHDDGQFQYCVSTVEDITQQELAEQSVRQMSAAMVRIQEEEQRRIAREVHDSTSQEMTALILNLGALKKSPEISASAQKNIVECLALARHMSSQIRTFSYLLHPPMLSEFGLWSALRVFVEEFRSRSRQSVSLEIAAELEADRLDPRREMALFRFVQEALANVHRHAGSKSVSVKMLLEEGCIRASVADTGRGMPSKILEGINSSSGGLAGVGITGMKERIHQIGGYLEIASDRTGTTVTAVVPAGQIVSVRNAS
jgi:PAS domain S-box-containing protein